MQSLKNFIQSKWNVLKETHICKGIISVVPNAHVVDTVKNSPLTQSLILQILYFNFVFYLLPSLVSNLMLNFDPIYTSKAWYLLQGISGLYSFNNIATMFLYNSILTLCVSSMAASQTIEVDQVENSICKCSKSDKLQQLFKGSLYYLSNNIFTSILSVLTSFIVNPLRVFILSFVVTPLKMLTQGHGFVDGYLANTGVCPRHRRTWLAKHNLFSFGIGLSYVLTQYLSEYAVTGLLAPNLNLLNLFIIQDSLANIIWLGFMYNIHFNPSIISLSDEYFIDFFIANNLLVDIIYDYAKPKITDAINNLEQFKTNQRFQSFLPLLKKTLKRILPKVFTDRDVLLTTAPMQQLLVQNHDSLMTAILWLKRLDSVRYVVTDSEWIISRERLKFIFSNIFPRPLVSILFAALTRGYITAQNINWFEGHVERPHTKHRRHCHNLEKKSFITLSPPTPPNPRTPTELESPVILSDSPVSSIAVSPSDAQNTSSPTPARAEPRVNHANLTSEEWEIINDFEEFRLPTAPKFGQTRIYRGFAVLDEAEGIAASESLSNNPSLRIKRK